MNRARHEGETFEEYKEDLKREADATRMWLKGVPAAQGMTPRQYLLAQERTILEKQKEINGLERTIKYLKEQLKGEAERVL